MDRRDIEVLIDAIRLGEGSAFDRLVGLLDRQLMRTAWDRLREVPWDSRTVTAELVDDAYAEMSRDVDWEQRSDEHFEAAAEIAVKRVNRRLGRARAPHAGRALIA
ncbi:hypothetical protein ABI59_10060 [Acidobacteria bacterium Mor1]|nr:hypothetical protein ABI59_10060 [Acidobacteria bacterium Mor1]